MYPILFVFATRTGNRRRALDVSYGVRRNQPRAVEEDRAFSEGRQLPGSSCDNQQVESGDRFDPDLWSVSREVSTRRDDIEKAMEESLMEVLPRLEKRTHYLATLANIATLLGLLGTIIGLISAFTAVSNANPADKADLLSASHFGRDEHDGIRPDVRNSTAACSCLVADEDEPDCGQPRNGQRQVSERSDRTTAEAGRSVKHDS